MQTEIGVCLVSPGAEGPPAAGVPDVSHPGSALWPLKVSGDPCNWAPSGRSRQGQQGPATGFSDSLSLWTCLTPVLTLPLPHRDPHLHPNTPSHLRAPTAPCLPSAKPPFPPARSGAQGAPLVFRRRPPDGLGEMREGGCSGDQSFPSQVGAGELDLAQGPGAVPQGNADG